MISASEFRNGVTFELEGNVYRVVEFLHVKQGKGAAFVRAKLKNVITSGVVERTFNPSDKYPKAHIERKAMQYLYSDGELFYFMDNETFEQTPLSQEQLGDSLRFVKENMDVTILSYKCNFFAVEPPNFVELEITETEPGLQGSTSSNVTKSATLETGAVVNVPLFINNGEIIRIDTRTGEYMSRA